jgi:hypothetical protein
MKLLMLMILSASAPSAAYASPIWIETGVGAASPSTGLTLTDIAIAPDLVTSSAQLQPRRGGKAIVSPYVSVMRDGPAHLRFRLTYRHFAESSVGNPDPSFVLPPCNPPPDAVCPKYAIFVPGRQMSFSSNAAHLGLTREFPITKTLTFEADLDAGLAVTRAHGHATTSFETGIQNDFLARSRYKAREQLNFSYGVGAGLSAKVTPNVRVVGKVNFFDLGSARTGINENVLGSNETLSGHPTAVSGSLGLRIKM